MSEPPSSKGREVQVLPWLALGLSVLGALALCRLLAPLVLAAWFAALMRPWVRWLAERLGRRAHAAALLTLGLVLGMLVPVALVWMALASGALKLVQQALHTSSLGEALRSLVGSGLPVEGAQGEFGLKQLTTLARQHGDRAMGVLATTGEATIWTLVYAFVFFLASYVFLLDGRRIFAWLILHSPLSRRTMSRLGGAVTETGRGLLTGIGLTGLTQGVLTSCVYWALGVPRPLALGALTCLFAMIPVLGTPMVWVPVAIGLALTGHTAKAAVMTGLGLSVILFVDNVLYPWYARLGKLKMPTWLLIVAIFGGIGLMGPWGALLGPLWVRLAREALEIARERGLIGPRRSPASRVRSRAASPQRASGGADAAYAGPRSAAASGPGGSLVEASQPGA